MARQGITYGEVVDAATQLLGQGRHPTIEQVRIILGTGSSTTIANHLKTWKETQSSATLTASREQIPDELIAIVKGLWDRVITLSDNKLTAITTDYQTTLNQKHDALEKYQQNNRRWQQLYHQLMQEKDGVSQAKQAAESLIENMREEHAVLETKYKLATQQLVEKQERQHELHHHLQQTQKNLEQFQESTRQQRQTEQSEMAALKKVMQKENAELRSNLDALQHDFNTLRVHHHKVLHERDNVKNEIAVKVAALENQQTEHQTTKSQLIECQAQIKFVQQQLAVAQQELHHSREQNKQLEKQNWSLLQEKILVVT